MGECKNRCGEGPSKMRFMGQIVLPEQLNMMAVSVHPSALDWTARPRPSRGANPYDPDPGQDAACNNKCEEQLLTCIINGSEEDGCQSVYFDCFAQCHNIPPGGGKPDHTKNPQDFTSYVPPNVDKH